MQIDYQTGDRVLVDGDLFEVAERRSNRWGGATYRLVSADGTAKPRWLTPRFERSKAAVVDRRALHDVVHGFYARVRADRELAPIFEARLAGRWEPHLEHMISFWSSVLLDERSFTGNPMAKHKALSGVRPAHFFRWLMLFHAQLDETFSGTAAKSISMRALAMARGLSTGMFGEPFDRVDACN